MRVLCKPSTLKACIKSMVPTLPYFSTKMARLVEKQFQTDAFLECIDAKTSTKQVECLIALTGALRFSEFRDTVEDDVFMGLKMVLEKSSSGLTELQQSDDKPLCIQLITECFRSLRNACIQCAYNQNRLVESGFTEVTIKILSILHESQHTGPDDGALVALRCGIQFLGNLAVQNQNCKDDIWKHGFPKFFSDLLEGRDEKVTAYTCMVLHTCLNEPKVDQLVKQQDSFMVALKILELCATQSELDWAILIVTEHFLKSQELVEKMYFTMNPQNRLTLLELVAAHLTERPGEYEQPGVPPATAEFLAACFKKDCKAVLLLESGTSFEDEEAIIVIRLLDILCEMSSGQLLKFLQNSPDLLETTLTLLREVHILGKEHGNVFSSVQDFSKSWNKDTDNPHPVTSFKAHLVRLVGNLCHKNTPNQNKVRDLDGIALILDNSSIDSNNPFISQWSVFALRNILENNKENQDVVQRLKMQGVADISMLRDMGFRVEERDGSLLLRPVNKDGAAG